MFDEPGSADQFSIKDHVGDLVLVAVNGFTPQFPTAFGVRDTIRCKIAVVDSKDPAKVGTVYGDAMIFGSKIVPQLKGSMNRVVLGRMALGAAKPGQNAPYQLDKFSQDDAAAANKWVEENGPFEAGIEEEGAAPEPAPQQQQRQAPPQQQQQGQRNANPLAGAPTGASSYTAPPQTEQPPY